MYTYDMYRLPVFILFQMVLHRKIHRSRTVQIHHSLVAGSVPRSWLNALLLAQRLVAGSIFLNEKKSNAKKLSQLHALEPARYAVIIPANTYNVFVFSFHIRLPAQRDVAPSIFSFFSNYFFRSKKLSQLDAIER